MLQIKKYTWAVDPAPASLSSFYLILYLAAWPRLDPSHANWPPPIYGFRETRPSKGKFRFRLLRTGYDVSNSGSNRIYIRIKQILTTPLDMCLKLI